MASSPQDIWNRLAKQLQPLLGSSLRIVIPGAPSEIHHTWFHELENRSFRESLRYNEKELDERLKQEDVLFLFLIADDIPEGVILGNRVTRSDRKTFYLDTLAIRRKGKGIGKIVLSHLIEWAKASGYAAIELDTEAENEDGIPLKKFYETAGFMVQYIEDDGNITMSLIW